MTLSLEKAYSLHAPTHQRALTEFQGKTVHAIAGIGNPARFFHQLSDLGLTIIEHAFSDHHAFSSADFVAFQNDTLLLTEKDAVKCVSLSLPNAWVVPAKAILEPDFYARLLARLMELSTAPRKYDH